VKPLVQQRRRLVTVLATSMLVVLQLLGGAPAHATTSPPATTPSETLATLTPSLSPDRLGARAALTVTIHYTAVPFGLPSPVLKTVLRFPAGLSLEVPSLRSCSVARLRAQGAGGCPAQSLIGRGYAVVEGHTGSLSINEDVSLQAFIGPPRNLQPTVEILGQGYTPLDQRMLIAGDVLSSVAPYGEALVMSTPAIPTVPLEPDASIVTLSLTVGASAHRTRASNSVIVPANCPAGGFPFAAEFTYANGSSGSAAAKAPCPS
jgi:hypothetical protein